MIAKIKAYELAKQLGITSDEVIQIAQRLSIDIKSAMSALGSEESKLIGEYYKKHSINIVKKTTTHQTGPITEKRIGSKVIRRRIAEKPVVQKEEAKEAEKTKEEKVAPPSPETTITVKPKKKTEVKPVIKFIKSEPIPEKKVPEKESTEAKEKETKAVEKPQAETIESVVPTDNEELQILEADKSKESLKKHPLLDVLAIEKKKKAPPSIIKKVSTEQHLAETIGPKPKIEKKPKVQTAEEQPQTKATSFHKVKEITFTPTEPEVDKEATRRRLLRRQDTVFRSSDYLKRELIHATKKKKISRPALKPTITVPGEKKRIIEMGEMIQVGELSKALSIKSSALIKKLMELGVTVTVNENIDFDTATLVSHDFGYEIRQKIIKEEDYKVKPELDENAQPRHPVVTIMGHVDHGKTTLLDYIRNTKVADGEFGGITQHIGAYIVSVKNKGKITFIDTPGHEAFTAMRARGAMATDIVVLVVSAVDGVMPQTLESIAHAKAAKVPIVVAINKIDLPSPNIDRIKQTLASHELAPEEWGGDTIYVNVSAKTGKGVDELLENILLQSEVLELKANYKVPATGIIIESKLDKNKGPLASLIIKHGILKCGDILVSGTAFGKIRAMTDSFGKPVKETYPSYPVEVLGLNEAGSVGEEAFVVENEKKARELVEVRKEKIRKPKANKISIEEMLKAEESSKELFLILKTDVFGSSEAIKTALDKIPSEKVKLKIVYSGVGAITESDVNLAIASNAIIVGFNVRPDSKALKLAEQEKITVLTFRIIYELVDEVTRRMEGLLDKVIKESIIGHGEVRNIFNIPKVGVVAGSQINDGKALRGGFLRLMRNSKVIWEGKITSLKRFKDDVKEVAQGYECGIGLENYNDIKIGDTFEIFIKEEERTSLV